MVLRQCLLSIKHLFLTLGLHPITAVRWNKPQLPKHSHNLLAWCFPNIHINQIMSSDSIHTLLLLPTVHKCQFHSACKHTDVRSKCIKAVQQIQRPCHPYKIYNMKNLPQALGITIRSLILNISTNTVIRLITPLTNNTSPTIFLIHNWTPRLSLGIQLWF